MCTTLVLIFLSFCSIFTPGTPLSTIELECEVTESNPFNQRCNKEEITCTISNLLTKENTQLRFSNAEFYDYNALTFYQSKIPVFPREVFLQFPKLEYLEMRTCGIKAIQDGVFVNATKLLELNLESNKLKVVTADTFRGASSLTHLYLYRNGISKIASKAFDTLESLEFLDVSYNQVDAIDAELFAKLRNLKTLLFYSSSVTKIDPKSFWNNNKLGMIDMEGNELKELDLEFNSVKLHTFQFYGNRIRKLSLRNVGKNSTIQTVKVQGNHILDILIDESLKVRVLNIGFNYLTSLSSLTNLSTLLDIDLEGNQLKEVKPNDFKIWSKLKRLDLSSTYLLLQRGIFAGLSNLQSLTLRWNDLSHLDLDWFDGINNLTYLDLEGNKFVNIDYKGLANKLPSLKAIKLADNHFNCSFLREMVTFFDSTERIEILTDYDYGYADYESAVSGILCYKPRPMNKLKLIIVNIFIVVFIITVILIAKRYNWLQKMTQFSFRFNNRGGQPMTDDDSSITE